MIPVFRLPNCALANACLYSLHRYRPRSRRPHLVQEEFMILELMLLWLYCERRDRRCTQGTLRGKLCRISSNKQLRLHDQLCELHELCLFWREIALQHECMPLPCEKLNTSSPSTLETSWRLHAEGFVCTWFRSSCPCNGRCNQSCPPVLYAGHCSTKMVTPWRLMPLKMTYARHVTVWQGFRRKYRCWCSEAGGRDASKRLGVNSS